MDVDVGVDVDVDVDVVTLQRTDCGGASSTESRAMSPTRVIDGYSVELVCTSL